MLSQNHRNLNFTPYQPSNTALWVLKFGCRWNCLKIKIWDLQTTYNNDVNSVFLDTSGAYPSWGLTEPWQAIDTTLNDGITLLSYVTCDFGIVSAYFGRRVGQCSVKTSEERDWQPILSLSLWSENNLELINCIWCLLMTCWGGLREGFH